MRSRLLFILSTVAITLGVGIAQAANPAANPLLTDRGKFRPLVLVTPITENEDYQRMLDSIERQRDSFDGRRMLLYRIEEGNGFRADKSLTEFETRALLEALELDAHGPVQVVLVGLDGGKKVQLEGYVDPRQIFQTIDSMPMRQSEVEKQGNNHKR